MRSRKASNVRVRSWPDRSLRVRPLGTRWDVTASHRVGLVGSALLLSPKARMIRHHQ